MCNIEEHAMEHFKLLTPGIVRDHPSVLPEHAEVECRVQTRRGDEGRLGRTGTSKRYKYLRKRQVPEPH